MKRGPVLQWPGPLLWRLMRFTLLAVFLLSACATDSAHTVYGQGIVRPVRPPTFRPSEDAPHHVGQPGHLPGVRVAPQSNPKHKRPLPPTMEPGLWAGDAPRGANDPNDGWHPPIRTVGEPVPRIAIADVEIPTSSEARDAVDTLSTEQCAYITRLNILEAKIGYKMQRLSPEERACLIARAMAGCQAWLIDTWLATIETAQKAGIPLDEDPTERFHYGRLALRLISEWSDKKCSVKGADSETVRKYLNSLAKASERLQDKGSAGKAN